MKTRFIPIVVLAVAGLVAAPSYSWLTLAISVVLFAVSFRLGLGIIGRLLVSALGYSLLGAMAIQVTSLFGVGFSFTWFHVLMLLAGVGAAWRSGVWHWRSSYSDAAGLVVGVAVFMTVALPLFNASNSKLMQYMLPGEDNQSHLLMYRYVLTHKKYAYANKPESAGIRPTLLTYAQGSHAALAVISSPVASKASDMGQMKVFAIAAAAAFASLFWLGFLIMTAAVGRLADARLRFGITVLAALGYVLIVPGGVLLNLYTYGFFPQYFAYLSLSLLVLLAILFLARPQVSKRQLGLEMTTLSVALYGVFASWYLLSPVALPVLAAYLWVRRRQIITHKWRAILACLVPALLLVQLAYIFVFKTSGAGHILTTGGVIKLPTAVLLVAVPAVVLFVLHIRKRQWLQAGLAANLLVAAAMATLIGLYLRKKLGHFDYYFYKTMFSVLMMATIYYEYLIVRWLAGRALVLSVAAKKQGKIAKIHTASRVQGVVPEMSWTYVGMVCLGVVCLGVMYMALSPPKYLSSFLDRAYTLKSEPALDRPLDVILNPSLYTGYSDAIALNNCNPYTNFTVTIWSAAFFLPYTPERQALENSLQTRDPSMLADKNGPLMKDIVRYADSKDKPVALLLSDDCVDRRQVAQALKGSNVRVVFAQSVKW